MFNYSEIEKQTDCLKHQDHGVSTFKPTGCIWWKLRTVPTIVIAPTFCASPEGDPKSRNRGTPEPRKMTPNPKTRNHGKLPQILKHGITENDPKS